MTAGASIERVLDKCIHCGLCLDACPTYRQTHLEPDGPRGRIYLMRQMTTGRLGVDAESAEHIDRCLGCRACETACPSGVEYGRAIEWARERVTRDAPRSIRGRLWRWLGLELIVPRPWLLDAATWLVRQADRAGLVRLADRVGLSRWAFGDASSQLLRLLPQGAPAEPQPERLAPPGEPRARVAVLTGCVTERVLPELNRATARVLVRNGCETLMPRRQGCCGALALHGGLGDLGKRLALELIESTPTEVDFIVSNAAGCGATLKEYPALFERGSREHRLAAEFSAKVRDVCELLDELGIEPPDAEMVERVGYDDPCHLLHGQQISSAPKNLLRRVPGLRLVEIPDAETCCGSAGTYNLSEVTSSLAVLDEKMRNIERSRAEIVATGNPGCLLQIRAGAERRGLDIEVLHPVEILDRAYDRTPPQS